MSYLGKSPYGRLTYPCRVERERYLVYTYFNGVVNMECKTVTYKLAQYPECIECMCSAQEEACECLN